MAPLKSIGCPFPRAAPPAGAWQYAQPQQQSYDHATYHAQWCVCADAWARGSCTAFAHLIHESPNRQAYYAQQQQQQPGVGMAGAPSAAGGYGSYYGGSGYGYSAGGYYGGYPYPPTPPQQAQQAPQQQQQQQPPPPPPAQRSAYAGYHQTASGTSGAPRWAIPPTSSARVAACRLRVARGRPS
jgi:hypothetical protein